MYNTVSQNYRSALAILKKKPWLLIGLTLLAELIAALVTGACFAVPIISVPVAAALGASLSALHLKAVRGQPYETADLFSAFSDWNTIKRVIGGMLWEMLWIFIWGLIPIAGPIIVIIKNYEYAFTPYILMTRPEINATDALKESKRLTVGLKGRLFCANFIIEIIIAAILVVCSVFTFIPIIGGLFFIIFLLVVIFSVLALPVFLGLVNAFFYENATNPAAQAQAQAQYYQQYYNQQYYQNPQNVPPYGYQQWQNTAPPQPQQGIPFPQGNPVPPPPPVQPMPFGETVQINPADSFDNPVPPPAAPTQTVPFAPSEASQEASAPTQDAQSEKDNNE